MKITLIRSATILLQYAGKKIIIDPYLAEKHTLPSYTGKSPNPLVDLPCTPAQIIDGIDMAIISHLHSDHFDPAAQKLLPKTTPLLCQPEDTTALKNKGFQNLLPLNHQTTWQNIQITRTHCQHGTKEVLDQMGIASGFVIKNPNELTIYWAGDTIWCQQVQDTIEQTQPAIIITHSCGAVWGENFPIVMDAAQTVQVCLSAPASTIIAPHMEALDHATISRTQLRQYAIEQGISPHQLLIPADGESYNF